MDTRPTPNEQESKRGRGRRTGGMETKKSPQASSSVQASELASVAPTRGPNPRDAIDTESYVPVGVPPRGFASPSDSGSSAANNPEGNHRGTGSDSVPCGRGSFARMCLRHYRIRASNLAGAVPTRGLPTRSEQEEDPNTTGEPNPPSERRRSGASPRTTTRTTRAFTSENFEEGYRRQLDRLHAGGVGMRGGVDKWSRFVESKVRMKRKRLQWRENAANWAPPNGQSEGGASAGPNESEEGEGNAHM